MKISALLVLGAVLGGAAGTIAREGGLFGLRVQPVVTTEPVGKDADDPAVWVHPTDASQSIVIGTDKGDALYVFDLNGKTIQVIDAIDHPNNVDVEYGFSLGGEKVDLAVVTERGQQGLRIYRIDPSTRKLIDVTGHTKAFDWMPQGEARATMGIALYKRPRDGAIFACIAPKEGGTSDYLAQYRLVVGKSGKIDTKFVRKFGNCHEGGEIEALVVDDALGYLYAAEEKYGIRKFHADPDQPDANRQLAVFGLEGYPEDREGMGIWCGPDGKGYLVSSNQMEADSEFIFYPREGSNGDPHHHPAIKSVFGGADDTDGVEVISTPLGPRFPQGAMIVMNSKGRNFFVFDWRDLAAARP